MKKVILFYIISLVCLGCSRKMKEDVIVDEHIIEFNKYEFSDTIFFKGGDFNVHDGKLFIRNHLLGIIYLKNY